MQRIETVLDEATIKELDHWRGGLTSRPSRSDAVRLLLEERLASNHRVAANKERNDEPYPDLERLGALYALERITGFGPVKFREMHDAGVSALEAIEDPSILPIAGRTGEKLRREIAMLPKAKVVAAYDYAKKQIESARSLSASILTHGDSDYPERVYVSNAPVPVLYVRGDTSLWNGVGSVAVVGSRNIRDPYSIGARRFATTAASQGMLIVSGFAMGADSIGHSAALEAGGKTVCVMPCGLDKVFPPENRDLWEELLAYPNAVFVSEFGFGLRASSLLLRKRNKLIVAFSESVMVAQSATDGGAMNAYRFAREQKKSVVTFRPDGSKETSGNAMIEKDDRTGGFAFDLDSKGSQFKSWLRQPSSLI